ncbi:MAG: DUF6056 family protein, partial [bacterium]|nr:DUF6056 family protein [bacterium]
ILFLLLNPTSFSQCYTWIAGSITYLYPAIIVLTYFYYLYKKKYFKFSKIEYLILLIVNIITPMFVENIGVAFVFGNLLWLFLNRHAEKKELIKFGILTIFSIGALILMLLSPGTAFRTTYELGFYNMSLIGRMFYNIPNLIGYAITRNIIVLIMMTLAIIYTLKKKNIKIYKLILFAIVPIFGIIQNIYLMIPFAIGNDLANKFAKFWGVFNVNNWYFIFYWILFVALFFYAIVYNFKDSKEKSFLIVLTLVAGVALVSMLVAPIWGERVAIFTEIILLIISLKIIKDCFNRKYNKLLISFMGVLLSYFIIMFSLIFIVQKDRDAYIKYQLQDEKVQEIEVYNHFITYVWTRAPWGDYHSNVFKNYYGIDEKISLKIVNHKFSLAFYDALKKLE